MNAYRDVMQQLSCVPLDQLDQFEHDAVIRAAFIIEEVQTKISTKNQKKFAILTISDGSIRFELPIWAELYEEKSPLIVENQLIYAVLQIDKKEEEIKLHCRWFDDLTQAGESMINTCDAAFEKAKNFVTKSSSFRDRSMSRNKEQKKKETGKLSITLEMEKLRLSHILEIKKIFRHHSGNMPVELSFQSEAQTIGVIHIDAAWGIQYEKALEQKLSSIASIRQVLHQL